MREQLERLRPKWKNNIETDVRGIRRKKCTAFVYKSK